MSLTKRHLPLAETQTTHTQKGSRCACWRVPYICEGECCAVEVLHAQLFILMYSRRQKKVPVPFTYNGGSTVLRLKKDCAKTLLERYGCVFTDRFTTRLYDEAFSSTVYVM